MGANPALVIDRPARTGFRVGAGTQFFSPKRASVDLQLNVDNLLDYDKQLVNGLLIHHGVNLHKGSKFAPLGAVRLTTTLRF